MDKNQSVSMSVAKMNQQWHTIDQQMFLLKLFYQSLQQSLTVSSQDGLLQTTLQPAMTQLVDIWRQSWQQRDHWSVARSIELWQAWWQARLQVVRQLMQLQSAVM